LPGGLSVVVGSADAGLMSSSPQRPAQPVDAITSGPHKQGREQAPDLVAGVIGCTDIGRSGNVIKVPFRATATHSHK
jgi:hypothetical protein